MALKSLVIAFGVVLVASAPAAAGTNSKDAEKVNASEPTGASKAAPETKYCMRIEAITGSRLEEVKCWTRAEWAEQGVDVDHDWAAEGVRVIEA